MLKLLFIFLACILTNFAGGFAYDYASSQEKEQKKEIIKIGLIFPLTGPMASFGEDIAKALPLLEKKFNQEQSKYKFVLLLEDGKFGNSNAAITAAKKLITIDGVKFLVTGSSGETLQVAPFAESSRVLTVAGFASHPDVKNSGDYIFRTYIDAERGIRLVADDMIKKNYQRIALISEESSFTLAIERSLHNFLADKIVFSENFAIADADFNTLVTKSQAKQPQAYYLNISVPGSFITLVQQLRSRKIKEPFYTYYTPSLKDVQKNLGNTLDGVIFLDYPDTLNSSADFATFLSEYEHLNGTVRSSFNFKTNYNAVKVIFDGIMAVGTDSSKVKDFLYKYDQPSATGQLQFDTNGDIKNLDLTLKTYATKNLSN